MKYVSQKEVDMVKRVFFMAMNAGYAVEGVEKTRIPELPGSRLITSKHRINGYIFVVNDLYFVRKDSPSSFGSTIISCDGEPVWSMSYSGKYPKSVVPFLKEALKYNYERAVFEGGRGPRIYPLTNRVGDFEYLNSTLSDSFTSFSGREEIIELCSGKLLGYHEYSGKLMLPVSPK